MHHEAPEVPCLSEKKAAGSAKIGLDAGQQCTATTLNQLMIARRQLFTDKRNASQPFQLGQLQMFGCQPCHHGPTVFNEAFYQDRNGNNK